MVFNSGAISLNLAMYLHVRRLTASSIVQNIKRTRSSQSIHNVGYTTAHNIIQMQYNLLETLYSSSMLFFFSFFALSRWWHHWCVCLFGQDENHYTRIKCSNMMKWMSQSATTIAASAAANQKISCNITSTYFMGNDVYEARCRV